MPLLDLTKLEAEQEDDNLAIHNAIGIAEQKIGKLSPDLNHEALTRESSAIRKDAEKVIQARLKSMQERAGKARKAWRRYTFDAVMRSSKFHTDPVADASIRNAITGSFSRTATTYLLEHLEDAIEDDNLAKAQAVSVEFQSRTDRSDDADKRYTSLMEDLINLKTPQVEESQRSLKRTIGLVDVSQNRYRELLSGQSDPARRIAAFRAAGKSRAA